MRYLDLNCGLFGAQLALNKAGFSCELASGAGPLSESVYKRLFPSTNYVDLSQSKGIDPPDSDLVFLTIAPQDLADWSWGGGSDGALALEIALNHLARSRPKAMLLSSSRAALNYLNGYPFAALLSALRDHGYAGLWLRPNARLFRLPHDSHLTLVICVSCDGIDSEDGAPSLAFQILTKLLHDLALGYRMGATRFLSDALETTKRRVGASFPSSATKFASCGWFHAESYQELITYTSKANNSVSLNSPSLSDVVCPHYDGRTEVYAARLVSRYGNRAVCTKSHLASYALGPSLSASPLFATRPTHIPAHSQDALLAYSNWNTRRNGWLVFRLTPGRAALLHGLEATPVEDLLNPLPGLLSSKYSLVALATPPRITNFVVKTLVDCGVLLQDRNSEKSEFSSSG